MSERIQATIRTPLSTLRKVVAFYVDGFRQMTIGKTLWAIILIKLFIFFVILKWIFFPNLLAQNFDTDEQRAQHVRHELTNR